MTPEPRPPQADERVPFRVRAAVGPAIRWRAVDIGGVRGPSMLRTVGALVLLLAPRVAAACREPRVTPALWLLAPRPLISACRNVAVVRRERALDFQTPAVVARAEAVAQTLFSRALAMTFGLWALLGRMLAGSVAAVVVSYVVVPGRPRFVWDSAIFARFRRSSTWLLVASVADTIGEGMLATAIARVAGTAAYGAFALAANVALVPAAMIGSLVSGGGFAVDGRIGNDAGERRQCRS